jgi:hypothetical protein
MAGGGYHGVRVMGGLLTAFGGWFASLFVAKLLVKISGFLFIVGISQTAVNAVIDQIFNYYNAYQFFDVMQMAGVGNALGILAGGFTYKLTLMGFRHYVIGPRQLNLF